MFFISLEANNKTHSLVTPTFCDNNYKPVFSPQINAQTYFKQVANAVKQVGCNKVFETSSRVIHDVKSFPQ